MESTWDSGGPACGSPLYNHSNVNKRWREKGQESRITLLQMMKGQLALQSSNSCIWQEQAPSMVPIVLLPLFVQCTPLVQLIDEEHIGEGL